MESISTPRSARLPWAANIATLAVVCTAVWWSGAQRPAQAPLAQIQAAPLPVLATPPDSQPALGTQQKDTEPAPLRVQTETVDATVAQASVRTVVYKPASNN